MVTLTCELWGMGGGAFWQLFQQATIKCGYTRRLWSNSNGQQVGTSRSSHRLGPFLQANTWHSSASCARQNGPCKSCPPCSAAHCCVIALQQEVGSMNSKWPNQRNIFHCYCNSSPALCCSASAFRRLTYNVNISLQTVSFWARSQK